MSQNQDEEALFENGYVDGWNKDPTQTTFITGFSLGVSVAIASATLLSVTSHPTADKIGFIGLGVAGAALVGAAIAAGTVAVLNEYDLLALGELKFEMIQDNLSNYNFVEIINNNPILKKYIITLPFVISKFNVKDENGDIVDTRMLCYYYDKDNNKVVFIDKIQAPNGKVIYEVKDNDSDDLNIDPGTFLMRIVNNSNINNNKFIIINNNEIADNSNSFHVNINIKHSGFNLLFNKPAIKGSKSYTGGKYTMLGNRRR
jgi:hypothetical protein